MKAMVFVCWGLMIAGLVFVAAAGHTGPAGFAALSGMMICLAGIFFILYQATHKLGLDKNYALSGKGMTLIFVLAGTGILLALLGSFLE